MKFKIFNLQFLIFNLKKERGVGLVEIMVIVSIMITLALLGIPKYLNLSDLGVRNGAINSTTALVKALAMYKADKGFYPCDPVVGICDGNTAFDDLKPYMNVTSLVDSVVEKTSTSPDKGMAIFRAGTPPGDTAVPVVAPAACIYISVRELSPPGSADSTTGWYGVIHCAQTSEAAEATKINNNPSCRWKGKHDNWLACSKGL